jgi:hypothetical protein
MTLVEPGGTLAGAEWDSLARGVGSALAAERLSIARAMGYREGWRMIGPRNLPSLRTLRAGGSTRIVGEIRFVQLLSLLRASFVPVRFRV